MQKTNQDSEERIRELEDAKSLTLQDNHRLERDVEKLHAELRDIDELAKQLEQEKQVWYYIHYLYIFEHSLLQLSCTFHF